MSVSASALSSERVLTFGMELQLACCYPAYSVFLTEENKLGEMSGEMGNSKESLENGELNSRTRTCDSENNWKAMTLWPLCAKAM